MTRPVLKPALTSHTASPRKARLTAFHLAWGSAPPRSHAGGSITLLDLVLLVLFLLPPLALSTLCSLLLLSLLLLLLLVVALPSLSVA